MKLTLAILFAVFSCAISAAVDPAFTPSEDVIISVFTRTNRNAGVRVTLNADSIRNSPFLATRPTRIVIHGWLGDGEVDLNVFATPALLDAGDFNVIVVDWSAGANTINYAAAVLRVPPVGRFIATFVDFLHQNNFIEFSRLKVVGFSLGAHIAGHVGKSVGRGQIDTIIGLDPAGPLFSVNSPNNRLAATDARYVEAIHTSSTAGISAPIAQADFFPNGGSSQPGCLTPTCNHDRAVDFWVEGLRSNRFFGMRCNDLAQAQAGNCAGQPGAWISSEPSNSNQADARGIFHFTTSRLSPFANGPLRPF